MAEMYSLWQQGKTNGVISSMTPHACSTGASMALGVVGVGLEALSVIAQFGIWYEQHKMRVIGEAQFEERRLAWLNQALDLWIEEHRSRPGIVVDATSALAQETDKVLAKLLEHDQMDVPQVLLLKASRVADYFDQVSAVWSQVLKRMVQVSGSSRSWRIEFAPSQMVIAEDIEAERTAAGDGGGNWLTGALGVAASFVPVVGTALASGLIAMGVGGEVERHQALKRVSRKSEYPQLLRLVTATAQALAITGTADHFLQQQRLPTGSHLLAAGKGPASIELSIGGVSAGRRSILRALPAPGRTEGTARSTGTKRSKKAVKRPPRRGTKMRTNRRKRVLKK